jgi:16S rRNA (cytidine1402-2'-O)-methyltransferase
MPDILEKGQLWLIPVPIADQAVSGVPGPWKEAAQRCQIVIAERGKTARKWLKDMDPDFSSRQIEFIELNKHGDTPGLEATLAKALQGTHIGLMSEAGCPGVADPGAEVVALAHRLGIRVMPLVGPSSLLLALMASGLNGQQFYFKGYLPAKVPELKKEIRFLEQLSAKERTTILFIETPYRSESMVRQLLETLNEHTRLCIARALDSPDQWIRTASIREWKKMTLPDLSKMPCVFLFLAA